MRIGIGITTHNRYDVFKNTYNKIKEFLPPNAKLVVVDDASSIPVPEATYRFETNVGIAKAKNKVFELLDDCDHIFTFDDDCWPIAKDWWKPYVESSEPHLNYIFVRYINEQEVGDSHLLYRDSKIEAFTHPRGCMLYIDHKCLDEVGGMDERFNRWGFEHVAYSNRIFNAGLTSFRYMDIPGSDKLFYSLDEHLDVKSTVDLTERRKYLLQSRPLFNASYSSKEYCKYKPEVEQQKKEFKNNVILTSYFAGLDDPQGREPFKPYFNILSDLINSVGDNKIVILHNCFDDIKPPKNVELIKTETYLQPYFQRWISYYQYLKNNKYDAVWIVDSTDVQMLRDPYNTIDDKHIYTGDEPIKLFCQWMLNNHRVPFLTKFIQNNRNLDLLNAGVLGGTYENVLEFIHQMVRIYSDEKANVGAVDMGLFNYVARHEMGDKLYYGRDITTIFKSFDVDNKEAIWKHK